MHKIRVFLITFNNTNELRLSVGKGTPDDSMPDGKHGSQTTKFAFFANRLFPNLANSRYRIDTNCKGLNSTFHLEKTIKIAINSVLNLIADS